MKVKQNKLFFFDLICENLIFGRVKGVIYLIFKNIWYFYRNVTEIRLCPLLCFYLRCLAMVQCAYSMENRKGLQ